MDPLESTCHVIAVVNGKGGVGKTSTAANLAGILAAEGYRVCAVDTDPQGDLGLDLGTQHSGASDDGQGLLQAAIGGGSEPPVIMDVRPRLDAVSGGYHLEDLAAALASRRSSGRPGGDTLTRSLRALATSGRYDVVVVDCPPGGHALQESVLKAARWLLVPARTDQASLNGLSEIARRFTAAKAENPELTLLGVFLFGVGTSSRRVLREAREVLLAALEGLPTETVLTATIRHVEAPAQAARAQGHLAYELEEAAATARPWYEQRHHEDDDGGAPAAVAPRSSTGLAADYHNLAAEVLTRIATLSQPAPAQPAPAVTA